MVYSRPDALLDVLADYTRCRESNTCHATPISDGLLLTTASVHPPSVFHAPMMAHRDVFNDAYNEVRYILQANIVNAFTETKEFRSALERTEVEAPCTSVAVPYVA